MHISSLPAPGGIGTLGRAAYDFVDFLTQAGQSFWQMLPIGPTGHGDSPYQSFSAFAGNPCLIDLEALVEQGLLTREEVLQADPGGRPDTVNYGAIYVKRYPLLLAVAKKFLADPPDDYGHFCAVHAHWLEDYALFMALKDIHSGAPWQDWTPACRRREANELERFRQEHGAEITTWKVMQYLFFSQWEQLKTYANARGIRLIGDLPIYVAMDSVEVWACPELFQLDECGIPREVAGCPPDGFSPDGQLWGNPLYDWERMEQTGYSWWIRRIGHSCRVYDVLRLDHFRGFDSYYAIPAGETTAHNGRWRVGPGMKLFRAVEQAMGRQNMIAEDLGFLTDSVRQLLRESGLPGMKVLQFAFDGRNGDKDDYLPHNYPAHCVAYIGTHDNDTILGWLSGADFEDAAHARAYLRLGEREANWDMMCSLWASPADLTVVQAQDLLGLGSESRMNTPGTLGGNWRWRALPDSFTPELAQRFWEKTALYRRIKK